MTDPAVLFMLYRTTKIHEDKGLLRKHSAAEIARKAGVSESMISRLKSRDRIAEHDLYLKLLEAVKALDKDKVVSK